MHQHEHKYNLPVVNMPNSSANQDLAPKAADTESCENEATVIALLRRLGLPVTDSRRRSIDSHSKSLPSVAHAATDESSMNNARASSHGYSVSIDTTYGEGHRNSAPLGTTSNVDGCGQAHAPRSFQNHLNNSVEGERRPGENVSANSIQRDTRIGVERRRLNTAVSAPDNRCGGSGVASGSAQVRSATTTVATAAGQGLVDLTRCEITAREASLLCPTLRAATGIQCLKLCYNHLRDAGAEAVSNAIERHPSLHTMDLGFNDIGDPGATSLARSLVQNRSLSTLYLSGNSIGSAGARAIARSLATTGGLTTLHLTGNCIGPEGAAALAGALKSNTSLERLYIDGAGIKSRGARSVASSLISNGTLSDLHVSDNEIGDEGLAGLSLALRQNRSIRLLELCFNRITAAGAEALAKSAWGCTTLLSLRLDNNKIGDEGAKAIASVLPTMALENVELGFNNIGAAGVSALMHATVQTRGFTSLSLSGNALDAEAAKAIQSALAQPSCPLVHLYLDHTNLGRASEGFIASGVLSNRSLALKTLTGFRLGAAFVRMGMPPQVQDFTNEQALEQVRVYWSNHGRDGGAAMAPSDLSGSGEGFWTNNLSSPPALAGHSSSYPVAHAGDGTQEVLSRMKALGAFGAGNGVATEERKQHSAVGGIYSIPRSGEGGCGDQLHRDAQANVPSVAPSQVGGNPALPPKLGTNGASTTVYGPSHISVPDNGGVSRTRGVLPQVFPPTKSTAGDRVGVDAVGVGGRARSVLVEALHEIAKQPFSEAELWTLHQFYFSPPPDPRATPMEGGVDDDLTGAADGAYGDGIDGPLGSRRSRRSSSVGQEDDNVDSPRPPSKRYRNSLTRTRISWFPAIEAHVRFLKTKPDEHGILTLLRRLKYLQTSSISAQLGAAGPPPISAADQLTEQQMETLLLEDL